MGHWSHNKVEKNEMLAWQAEYNSSSLDGCPGLRTAMRDHKETVWVSLARSRMRRIMAQRDAVGFGMLLGVIAMLLVHLFRQWSGII